ncbi:hypothetical protein CMO91_05295 [Candidatus Woesearchaeota archaeon]|jgi:hypothetical protein|nr:hypothetical protein [Candidatus Woesearchaeota archaeon]|tara:strand:+ start:509 stop:721 length:213 start_codon:yes stop_codon:yes gene_type:complete
MTEATVRDLQRELTEIKKHMVSKEELASVLASLEISSNEKTMEQVKASEKDIKEGRTKQIKSVKDLLAEM